MICRPIETKDKNHTTNRTAIQTDRTPLKCRMWWKARMNIVYRRYDSIIVLHMFFARRFISDTTKTIVEWNCAAKRESIVFNFFDDKRKPWNADAINIFSQSHTEFCLLILNKSIAVQVQKRSEHFMHFQWDKWPRCRIRRWFGCRWCRMCWSICQCFPNAGSTATTRKRNRFH